ncbi:MAG: DUF882 domain-containing protein [Rhizobiales bacterium]|nr:DUF882 domain-containing protein [Hyphomicrobiales bacterium]
MGLLRIIFTTNYRVVISIALTCLLFLLCTPSKAHADTRSISLYMINTKQKLTVTYKVNGRYVPAAMKKINNLLRDWRANQATRMSPKLIDLLWSLHRELGSKREIRVISGYRSPKTNAMLRRKSKGVAKKSNHMRGLATDVYFPDVSVRTLREAGLLKRAGGVGYYPRSRIPFVHIDVGNVRHWPRMKSSELAALFKRGKPYGGYKRKPVSQRVVVALKTTSKSRGGKVSKPIRKAVLKVSKPTRRPQYPIVAQNIPQISPNLPKLRPSISDPETLSQQILLASVFADEEDGDILSLEENYLPDEITTNLSAKKDLSFYPIRDYPDLELLEAPISIGFSESDAASLLANVPIGLIQTFNKSAYVEVKNLTF